MDAALLVCSDTGAVVDADSRSWAEILVTTNGQVVQNHRKFKLTRSDLDVCAAQIRENGDKLPLDYDHSYVENGNTVASGWFTGEALVLAKGELRPNGSGTKAAEDELWAQVEWTPQAAGDIKAKRYRFISAEFRFGEQVKGVWQNVKEFVAATLTNRPFFGRMEAVTLSRVTTSVVWDTTAGYQHVREKLAAALNPPDTADGDMDWRYWVRDIDISGLKALVEDSQEACTYVVPFTLDDTGEPVPSAQADWVEAEQQWVSAAKAAESAYTGREATTDEGADMDTTVLAKSLGLADDATEEQITTAINAATEKASKADELATEVETLKNGADKTELETLREELKVERTKRVENERETILASAITDGRMLPAEKESLVEVFGENVEGLRKVLDARPKNAVLAREAGSSEGGKEGDVETAGEAERFKNADKDPIDEDSLTLHAKALQILGKDDYSETEYLAALSKAERGDAVTA